MPAHLPQMPLATALALPLREPSSLPKIRTPFESGAVSSRPRFTRARKKFACKWEKLYPEEFEELEQFFAAIGSGRFLFTHPLTRKQYECMVSDDELDNSLGENGLYDVGMNIEEV